MIDHTTRNRTDAEGADRARRYERVLSIAHKYVGGPQTPGASRSTIRRLRVGGPAGYGPSNWEDVATTLQAGIDAEDATMWRDRTVCRGLPTRDADPRELIGHKSLQEYHTIALIHQAASHIHNSEANNA